MMLISDTSGGFVHLMYLPLLEDLEYAGYSWGSVVLAHLYHELCDAIDPEKMEFAGCMHLLQVWGWDRFLILQLIDS